MKPGKAGKARAYDAKQIGDTEMMVPNVQSSSIKFEIGFLEKNLDNRVVANRYYLGFFRREKKPDSAGDMLES